MSKIHLFYQVMKTYRTQKTQLNDFQLGFAMLFYITIFY